MSDIKKFTGKINNYYSEALNRIENAFTLFTNTATPFTHLKKNPMEISYECLDEIHDELLESVNCINEIITMKKILENLQGSEK